MRRYTFYLLVALLAFGIGSFIVFTFYFKTTEQTPIVSSNETVKLKSVEQTSNISQTNSDEEDIPTDEQFDEWKMNSFKPTLTKWLENKKIEEFIDLERNDGWAANSEHSAKTKLLDVNYDGKYELALQTGCAAVGNCEFWLFKKTKKSYEIILSTKMVQRFKLRKGKSHGYFDLETSSHGSSMSGGIAIYKFDGKEYKIDKCFDYEYETITKKNGESLYTKDGQSVTKDKPTLTPASCENW